MADQTYSDQGTAPHVTLRFLAAPNDINRGGKVHGGIVMRWIDEAAHVLATRWTDSQRNVAVYSGGIGFYRPIFIGDIVEVEACLLHTGSSSMHISVHVRSGDPRQQQLLVTTHCLTVFVALNDEGQTIPCPPWNPTTMEDLDLNAHALALVSGLGMRPPPSQP